MVVALTIALNLTVYHCSRALLWLLVNRRLRVLHDSLKVALRGTDRQASNRSDAVDVPRL